MNQDNSNIICTANFDIDQRPAVEVGEWAKWRGSITQDTNTAALRYSRPFTDEEQRKHFMQGVAYAIRRACDLVIASSHRPGHRATGTGRATGRATGPNKKLKKTIDIPTIF